MSGPCSRSCPLLEGDIKQVYTREVAAAVGGGACQEGRAVVKRAGTLEEAHSLGPDGA